MCNTFMKEHFKRKIHRNTELILKLKLTLNLEKVKYTDPKTFLQPLKIIYELPHMK
jgi:hypothetical protein